ncbi:DMT family transporter [Rhizohabitans arisaemae]|uniref:DMT family transporter n=1 Tax=Rhizohabitans arisaemae TaxID=2720610 RepID=UPI0024B23B55|nr:DMT family transporter [Rhizohabitans arisaemae]
MTRTVRGALCATSAMFLVGTLAAVSALVGTYPIYGGQALRYTLAAVLLIGIAGAMGLGWVRLTRRETLYLLALSATGLVLFNVFVIEAARHSSPTLLGTIVGSVPLILAIAGPLAAGRRPSVRVVTAASIVVAGATLSTGLGSGNLPGLLYSLGALACEVCFSLLAIPLLPKLGAVRISAYTTVTSIPMFIVVGLAFDGTGAFRIPSMAEALSLIYLGTVVSAGAFFLWYTALPLLGVDRAGLFAGMMPVGAIIGTLLLGLGTPTPGDLGGAFLVILGVLIGLSPEKPKVTGATTLPDEIRR